MVPGGLGGLAGGFLLKQATARAPPWWFSAHAGAHNGLRVGVEFGLFPHETGLAVTCRGAFSAAAVNERSHAPAMRVVPCAVQHPRCVDTGHELRCCIAASYEKYIMVMNVA